MSKLSVDITLSNLKDADENRVATKKMYLSRMNGSEESLVQVSGDDEAVKIIKTDFDLINEQISKTITTVKDQFSDEEYKEIVGNSISVESNSSYKGVSGTNIVLFTILVIDSAENTTDHIFYKLYNFKSNPLIISKLESVIKNKKYILE
jgi:hypothetical protein